MKKVFDSNSRMEAEIVRGKLEAHGIFALIKADDEGGTNPGLHLVLGCGVWVNDPDVDQALALISE